ncbi:DUF4429 domain-containing protein [Enterococcus sp. AZ109]|uniref:DUF4429 domain-containing protein n=1 Tax=Enterococcus sp. AZ109 TaxID=2774634 RepID=UPI003F207E19
MVDWKDIGKKALDVTKEVTEKSVDTFQEWKDDPERIAKVETKKSEKKVVKVEKKLEKKQKRENRKSVEEKHNSKKTYIIKTIGKTSIDLADTAITITRKGSSQIFKGVNTIPYSSITAVSFQPAGLIANGYIKFSVIGGNGLAGGLSSVSLDENSVIFAKKYNKDMEELKAYIDDKLSENTRL